MNFVAPWSKIAAAAIVACGIGYGSAANAVTVLTYGQVATTDTVTGTDDGTTTTITNTLPDVAVNVTQYLGGGAPFAAVFNMHLVSSGVITNVGGNLIEAFTGTASWTNSAHTINYLSASLTDALFAVQGAVTMAVTASEPPGSITFTSSVLNPAELLDPKGISFAFADVNPPAGIDGTTLRGFAGSIAGTSSANFIPEPISIAVLGVGLLGLGAVRRKRKA